MRRARIVAGVGLALGGLFLASAAPSRGARSGHHHAAAYTDPRIADRAPIDPSAGIDNIDHLVFVVQENRSFDQYFGTFPGADGLPRGPGGGFTVCIRDPEAGRCRHPFHDRGLFDIGGPHGQWASQHDVHGGTMDGFIASLEERGTPCTNNPKPAWACGQARPGPNGTPDVMGFHNGHDIPNYWAYARRFMLQDHMFAPADSWTLPSHLYLVSAWSAVCSVPTDASTCTSDVDQPVHWWDLPASDPNPYGWADITWLLHQQGVDWAYYVGPGTCVAKPCPANAAGTTVPAQNPLPGFQTVEQTGQIGSVKDNTEFFGAAASGNLPSVSWVMPTLNRGEHPPDDIGNGQAWVTRVINAVMEGPQDQWNHTAIFLTWDDWGGFYDHEAPIRIDANGYGIRTPGILISPYANGGIDHETLSFDAYLKLIEDRFLGGQRLDGENDGWPDPRPTTREDVPQLGDLATAFDWTRAPIHRLILDPWPSR